MTSPAIEKITIEIDGFGNAAFEENPSAEAARILRRLADTVEAFGIAGRGGTVLFDASGSGVGRVSVDLKGCEA